MTLLIRAVNEPKIETSCRPTEKISDNIGNLSWRSAVVAVPGFVS